MKMINIELTEDEANQFLEEYKLLKSDRFTIIQYISAYIRISLKEPVKKLDHLGDKSIIFKEVSPSVAKILKARKKKKV